MGRSRARDEGAVRSMGEVSREILIDTPAERVWALLADLEGVAAWAPNIARCRLLSAIRRGVGATRRVRHVTGITLEEEVVAWNAPHAYTYAIRGRLGPLSRVRETWTVQPAATSCVASACITYDVRLGVFGGVLDRLVIRLLLQRQMCLGLTGLKRAAESSAPVDEAVLPEPAY